MFTDSSAALAAVDRLGVDYSPSAVSLGRYARGRELVGDCSPGFLTYKDARD